MRRAFVIKSTLLISLFGLTGCADWPRAGLNGALYANTTAPVAALPAKKDGATLKTGQACATSYLGLWASGDTSIEAAKKNGGITEVATVEERFKHILLGVKADYCTVVTGY